MKKLIYICIVITVFFSCNKERNYVTFSGKINNPDIDSLIIFHPKRDFTKTIKLNKDGSFKDTIKVVNGLFSMTDNKDFTLLYLMNGDDIVMNFEGGKFNETISFEGDHAAENKFLATSMTNENKFFSNTQLMRLPKKDFDLKVSEYINDFNNRLEKETLDADFLAYEKKEIYNFKAYLEKEYIEKNYNNLVLAKGNTAPNFENYENFKGGDTSLTDFKGKYVYIDVWATWCKPCKDEIPSLEKLEKKYHNKNIEFVSISLDDKNGYKAWKNMVEAENLGGTQLYAKGDTEFSSAYRVKTIPRFILIDPEGNIVDANAPRPSNPQLTILLNSLEI